MKYFIIAGEASGDMHAAALMQEIKRLDPGADFRFLGGDRMLAVDGDGLIVHYRNMAFMGFVNVVMNYGKIKNNFLLAERALIDFQPDAVVLVDYPGFNLRMARFVKEHTQIPVYYYIAPKLWAWKTYRIHDMKKYVDHLLTIFPFETDFFARYHYPAHYVGNPTFDAIDDYRRHHPVEELSFRERHRLGNEPLLALLPGSRRQEVSACLPLMLEAVATFSDYLPVIAGAPGLDESFYRELLPYADFRVIFDETYELLDCSVAAVVNSGTATLETALLGTPQVVVYHVKAAHLASLLRKWVIKTPWVSLVNILSGKEVVAELVAHEFTLARLIKAIDALLHEKATRTRIQQGYHELRVQLGESGAASRAAAYIRDTLSSKTQ